MNWIKRVLFKKELERMDYWRLKYIDEHVKNAGLMGVNDALMANHEYGAIGPDGVSCDIAGATNDSKST